MSDYFTAGMPHRRSARRRRARAMPPVRAPDTRKSPPKRASRSRYSCLKLERAMGFEPTTPTLARLCSTPELRPHPCPRQQPGRPPLCTIAGAIATRSRGRMHASFRGRREPAGGGAGCRRGCSEGDGRATGKTALLLTQSRRRLVAGGSRAPPEASQATVSVSHSCRLQPPQHGGRVHVHGVAHRRAQAPSRGD